MRAFDNLGTNNGCLVLGIILVVIVWGTFLIQMIIYAR